MSLIFDALKKGHADASAPDSGRQSAPSSVVASHHKVAQIEPRVMPEALAGQRLSSLVIAALTGMLIAAGGAWLYWAGKASNLATSTPGLPANVQLAQSTPAPAPMPVPVPVPVPVLTQTPARIAIPAQVKAPALIADAGTVVPVPALTAKPAPTAVAKVALPATQVAPAPAAVAIPAVRAPVNTQVQVTAVVNSFDVRDAFQTFVKLLQMGQLAEAQVAADKISTAMGRTHVVSLRAQGYMALKKSDLNGAKNQYLQLIQLLPNDREAGLNLALIDWRLGDKEAASKRVAGLLENFPNDAEIQALHLNVRGQ